MASFSVGCSNGFLISHQKFGFLGRKTKSLRRYGHFCYSSLSFTSLRFHEFCKSQNGMLRNRKFSSMVNGNVRFASLGFCSCCKLQNGLSFDNEIKPPRSGSSGDKKGLFGKRESSRVRRRFSLRVTTEVAVIGFKNEEISNKVNYEEQR